MTTNNPLFNTFGLTGSTTTTQNPTISQKTHMAQTTLTDIIITDDNKPFGDRLQQKETGITRILLQNPNGLDLGLDGLTLNDIIDSRYYVYPKQIQI